MSFPRYENYRDSGVKWLGKVPNGWGMKRVKHLFEIKKRISGNEGYEVLSITQQGIKVKDIESGDGQLSMDYSKYQFVEVGDFAMNHMDLLTGGVDISSVFGVTSPDYRVFCVRDKEVCFDRYYLYLFQMGYRNKIFYAFGQGSSQLGRWRFPSQQFNSFEIPSPPIHEQKLIATFLDHETAKIDALITEQQRLISLLTEKRQTMISHAVTKGLTPNVRMKNSGIEWLGKVPEHWEILKLKRVASLKSGEGITSEQISDEGICPVFGGNGIRGYTDNYTHDGRYALIGRQGALCGNINYAEGKFWASEHAVVVSPTTKLITNWLGELLRAMNLNQYSISAAQPGLSVEAIGNLMIPFPPITEQDSIAVFLDHETSKMDTLTSEAQCAIILLQERRTALIAAAVTGRIDVRNFITKDAA